jgi:hypothetical protein
MASKLKSRGLRWASPTSAAVDAAVIDRQLFGTYRGPGLVRARPLDHLSVNLDTSYYA